MLPDLGGRAPALAEIAVIPQAQLDRDMVETGAADQLARPKAGLPDPAERDPRHHHGAEIEGVDLGPEPVRRVLLADVEQRRQHGAPRLPSFVGRESLGGKKCPRYGGLPHPSLTPSSSRPPEAEPRRSAAPPPFRGIMRPGWTQGQEIWTHGKISVGAFR
jgi:hypothetical protein